MITVRTPESIFQVQGKIQDGTFKGRWHFSFGQFYDPEYTSFGSLRVFNDDSLSPGSVWPLHYHEEIEVVTYCAGGEFQHADEHGKGGILEKGWVQHTTVGSGMYHSEINNRPDKPMRFVQMWFFPDTPGLIPSVQQKAVEEGERTNIFLPLASNRHPDALLLHADAVVLSCFITGGRNADYHVGEDRGAYLYLLEGAPVEVNGRTVQEFGAAKIVEESVITVRAVADSELLLVDTRLYL